MVGQASLMSEKSRCQVKAYLTSASGSNVSTSSLRARTASVAGRIAASLLDCRQTTAGCQRQQPYPDL